MTNGVGQAVSAPSAKQKAAAVQRSPKGDVSAFGKALRDDHGEAGRQGKPEAQPAATARWGKAAEFLSARLDANGMVAPAAPEIAPSVAPVPDTSRPIALEPPPPPNGIAPGELSPEGEANPSPKLEASVLVESVPAADPSLVRAADPSPVGNDPEPSDVDPLIELRRALSVDAGDHFESAPSSEPDLDEPAETPDKADDRAAIPPVDAPRTRFPEPLIYLAGIAPSSPQADAVAGEPEPEPLGKRAAPVPAVAAEGNGSQRSMAAAAQAAPLALASTGQPVAAQAAGATRKMPATANTPPAPSIAAVPTASQDGDMTSDEAKTPKAEPRTPAVRPAAAPAATNSTQAQTVSAQGGQATEQDGVAGNAITDASLADDDRGAGSSATANDPRRSEQPVAAPRVTVAAEQAFAAPAPPMANPTVAGLTDAIAASRPVPQPVPDSLGGTKPDASGTRTLQIQLNPAELGMVTAHLKVTGSQLSVELQVDSSEAYHRLTRDGDAIVASLRKHGYDIDTVTVLQPQAAVVQQGRIDSPAATAGSTAREGAQMPSGDSGSGGQGTSGQSSGRQGNGNFDGRENHAQTAPGRTGGGIFI